MPVTETDLICVQTVFYVFFDVFVGELFLSNRCIEANISHAMSHKWFPTTFQIDVFLHSKHFEGSYDGVIASRRSEIINLRNKDFLATVEWKEKDWEKENSEWKIELKVKSWLNEQKKFLVKKV